RGMVARRSGRTVWHRVCCKTPTLTGASGALRLRPRRATVLSGPLGYTEEPTPLLSGGSAEESTRRKGAMTMKRWMAVHFIVSVILVVWIGGSGTPAEGQPPPRADGTAGQARAVHVATPCQAE